MEIRAGSDNAGEAHWFFLRFTSKWKYFEGLKEWLSLELLLNPGLPWINTSHTKSFSKAILTKTVFSYWDLQTIFTITSTKLSEFCHSSTRQSTHGTVFQHLALPHLLIGFSLQVLFPWMLEGIKSFFIFSIYETR